MVLEKAEKKTLALDQGKKRELKGKAQGTNLHVQEDKEAIVLKTRVRDGGGTEAHR